jgi:arylsulfatase
VDATQREVRSRWDKLREETLARQIAGCGSRRTKLAAKPADIKDWDSLSADEKRLFARQMEIRRVRRARRHGDRAAD